eukprot:15043982-Alexandrium_andersonii.AAC.1
MPGWSIHRNLLDLLHLVWLGVAKDFCGSMMLVLCRYYPGLSISEALHVQWLEMQAWCKA